MNTLKKKILQELTINSRQTYKQIAQKIKSKKDSVAYNIKKLEQEGVINKYVPVFALNRLGFFSAKIYFTLKGLSQEKENEIINWLKERDSIIWIAKSIGTWNLMISFNLVSLHNFSEEKKEVLNYLSHFIADYNVSFIEDGFAFDRKYLFSNARTRKEFLYGGNKDVINLDKTEVAITQLIKNNARFEYIDLAMKLDLDARTIKNKIKQLQEKGVLQGFTVFLNIDKIGYQLHKLCIYLALHDKKTERRILEYLKQNPHTIHLIKCVGDWELEIELEHNNIIQVHNYISELRNIFYKEIRKIDLVTITKEEKLDFFPTM